MNWVKNLKIRAKLYIGFLFTSLLILVVGVVALISLYTISSNVQTLVDLNVKGLNSLSDAYAEFNSIRNRLTQIVLAANGVESVDAVSSATQSEAASASESNSAAPTKSLGEKQQVLDISALLELDIAEADESLNMFRDTKKLAKDTDDVTAMMDDWASFRQLAASIVKDIKSDNLLDATSTMFSMISLEERLESAFHLNIDSEMAVANDKHHMVNNISIVALIIMGVLLVLSVVLSFAIAVWFSNMIGKPIQKMTTAAE